MPTSLPRCRPLSALVLGVFLVLAAGCAWGAGQQPTPAPEMAATQPVPGVPTPDGAAALLAVSPTPEPPATARAEPTPRSTAELVLLPPSATPLPTAEPTLSPGDGLPCPAENPAKPAYLSYNLGDEPYSTPDGSFPVAPLMLERPVAGEGPLRLNLTFPYGSDGSGRYLLHNGLDMTEPQGTTLVAVADGVVVVAGLDADELFGWRCDWYGQLVVIQLDQPWQDQPVYALYGHVLEISVEEGQRVVAGDPVAEIGFGGVATAPHLHFEIRVGENRFGSTRNPTLWLRPVDPYGVLAGRLVDPAGHPWEGVTVTLITGGEETQFINTSTYLDDPDHLINPEPGLGENFVFGQVPAGDYELYVQLQGVEYRQRVTVNPGELTTAEIVTEPYRTPTPAPTSTP